MEEKAGSKEDELLMAQSRATRLSLAWSSCVILLSPASVGLAMAFSVTGLEFFSGESENQQLVLSSSENNSSMSSLSFTNSSQQSLPYAAMDQEEVSWFVSLMSVGLMSGIMVSGNLIHTLGCVWTLRLSVTLILIGWGLIAMVSNAAIYILMARFLHGFASGIIYPSSTVLLSEISVIRLRGMLTMSVTSAVNVGFLLGMLVGYTEHFGAILGIFSAPPIIFFMCSWATKESPVWLAKKSRLSEARESLLWLRGTDYHADPEMTDILHSVQLDSADRNTRANGLKSLLCNASYQVLTLKMGLLMVCQCVCGLETFSYYSGAIFKSSAKDMIISPYTVATLIQVVLTFCNVIVGPLVDRAPRRVLGLGSGCVLAAVLLAIGLLQWLQEQDSYPSLQDMLNIALPVLPLVFTLAYACGFGPVAWIYAGEIFPLALKEIGCTICFVIRFGVNSAQLKMYPFLLEYFGPSTVSFLHMLATLAGCVLLYFFLPETRGLTYTQISRLHQSQCKLELEEEPEEKNSTDL